MLTTEVSSLNQVPLATLSIHHPLILNRRRSQLPARLPDIFGCVRSYTNIWGVSRG
jgi:hypothetical protein